MFELQTIDSTDDLTIEEYDAVDAPSFWFH
jgi:hypothetical protein